jgi:uncharacterized protein YciI
LDKICCCSAAEPNHAKQMLQQYDIGNLLFFGTLFLKTKKNRPQAALWRVAAYFRRQLSSQ